LLKITISKLFYQYCRLHVEDKIEEDSPVCFISPYMKCYFPSLSIIYINTCDTCSGTKNSNTGYEIGDIKHAKSALDHDFELQLLLFTTCIVRIKVSKNNYWSVFGGGCPTVTRVMGMFFFQ